MTWFTLSILTALSFAVVNIADKFLLLTFAKSDTVAIKILGLFSGVICVTLLLSGIGSHQLSTYVLFPILAGVFEIIYIFFYLKAIEKEMLAYLIPFFSLAPVIILGISVTFVHESVRWVPLVGIGATILGIFLLVLAKEGKIKIQENKSVLFMLLSTFFFSIHSIFLDTSLNAFSLIENLMWSRGGVFLGALVLAACTRTFYLREFTKFEPYVFAISEMLYLITMYLFIRALASGNVTYVVGVTNIQPLFVFGLSYLFWRLSPRILQEEFRFRSSLLAVISIAFIVVGSFLINV